LSAAPVDCRTTTCSNPWRQVEQRLAIMYLPMLSTAQYC
jgi:hypothetical protein